MNVLINEYIENRVNVDKLKSFCGIVANPKSKLAFDNFFKINDIAINSDYLRNPIQNGLSKKPKNQIDILAKQTRSIDKIMKRKFTSRKSHGK